MTTATYPYETIRACTKADINADKFTILRNFLSIKKTVAESNEPIPLPLYLQQRYKITYFNKITPNPANSNPIVHNAHKSKEVKKLYVDTGHITELVKAILTPLCQSNKEQLFARFFNLEFNEDCHDAIIECIYTHSVYLQHAIDLYIELFVGLTKKNPEFAEKLINHTTDVTMNPITFGDEEKTQHCIKSNAELVGKLIQHGCIDLDMAKNIINTLISKGYNNSLCLILKHSNKKDSDKEFIRGYEPYLSELILNCSVQPKTKFLANSVLELIESDDDCDDE